MKHIKLRLWVKIVLAIIIILFLTYLYARYINTTNFKVKEYSIIDSKLPENFYGLKIVQISDIHYKTTNNIYDIDDIVKEINLLKPDIVIFTGDLFDKSVKYTDKDYIELSTSLKNIEANIEKLAIKGDNDNSNFETVINDSGFKNLSDTYEYIYKDGIDPILFIGISSNLKNNHINETITNIYKETKDYKYSILLLHEPDYIDKIDKSKFNLIFAGHSLNGQIRLPFIKGIIKFNGSKKYINEYYDLNNTKLYISNGLGTNKYKYRFLNKPSINLYRLRNK